MTKTYYYVFRVELKEQDRHHYFSGHVLPLFNDKEASKTFHVMEYDSFQSEEFLQMEMSRLVRHYYGASADFTAIQRQVIERATMEKALIDHWAAWHKNTGFQLKAWNKQVLNSEHFSIHWEDAKRILDQDATLDLDMLVGAYDNMVAYELRNSNKLKEAA
jgi:hypothetical protein